MPMKFSHRLKHAPNNPDMGASYKARIIDIRFAAGKIVCVWTVYTPKNRKKSKTVSKQSKKGA